MTAVDWLFAATAALLVIWAVAAAVIVVGDYRQRREWRDQDARMEWRAFVDAMRRLELEDDDDRGNA